MSRIRFRHPFLRTVHKIIDRKLNEQFSSERRKFIKQSGIIAAGLSLGAAFHSSCNLDNKKREAKVVIIGAGLSGLCAARTFDKAGIPYDIYEGAERAGGRIRSAVNLVADKNVVEMGGEFIDSNQEEIFELIEAYNLETIDFQMDNMKETVYYFFGKYYDSNDLEAAIEKALPEMYPDFALLPEYIETGNMAQWMFFDKLSIGEYFDQLTIPAWLKLLFKTAYEAEFGMDVYKQSALNFFSMFEPVSEKFSMFGDRDLRFQIKGGNELLIKKIEAELKQKIQFNSKLTEIEEHENGYKTIFKVDGKELVKSYEYCLMTIPFSVLRTINLKLNLTELKRKMIFDLGYGRNSRYFFGFNDAVWENEGKNGHVYSDLTLKKGMEGSRLQDVEQKTFIVTNTEKSGNELIGLPVDQQKQILLKDLDTIFPGASVAFNDRFEYINWHENELSKGSASAYTLGQWSLFYGLEFEPSGNLHYAGEHTSRVYQGTMNGAAETGRFAAQDIIKKIENSV